MTPYEVYERLHPGYRTTQRIDDLHRECRKTEERYLQVSEALTGLKIDIEQRRKCVYTYYRDAYEKCEVTKVTPKRFHVRTRWNVAQLDRERLRSEGCVHDGPTHGSYYSAKYVEQQLDEESGMLLDIICDQCERITQCEENYGLYGLALDCAELEMARVLGVRVKRTCHQNLNWQRFGF